MTGSHFSTALRERWQDPAYRAAHAAMMRRQWTDPAYRAVQAGHADARHRGQRNVRYRREQAERSRQRWRDPDFRAARLLEARAKGDRLRLTRDDILARIEPEPNSSCWLWTGYQRGYGLVRFQGRRYYAHRLVWALFGGAEVYGDDLHHTCRIKACVNPAHLRPLSRAEHARITFGHDVEDGSIAGSRPDWAHCDTVIAWYRPCPMCDAASPLVDADQDEAA